MKKNFGLSGLYKKISALYGLCSYLNTGIWTIYILHAYKLMGDHCEQVRYDISLKFTGGFLFPAISPAICYFQYTATAID